MDQKIADIVADMRFERRKPVSRSEKADYKALKSEISSVLLDLERLHLRLWHANKQHDYRSLSLAQAKESIAQLAERLDVLSR